MKESKYHHWKLDCDQDNIVWLSFDKENASVNTIDKQVLEELLEIIQSLEKGKAPKGLVIQSAKSSGFIAGADLQQFKNADNPDFINDFIRQGQMIFTRLANLPFPTVALIEGFCLGGGLEMALACRYRIAIQDPKTKLGLPEVMLGIHPGWGGTVRLPRLIGPLKAMDLILSGRSIDARTAKKMGVVDVVVPKRQALLAAKSYLQNPPKVRSATFIEKLPNFSFVRPLFGKILQNKVSARVNRAHYPAPFAAIQHWVTEDTDLESAFMHEAKSMGELIHTDTAKNLVRVFFLQEKLKALGKEVKFNPNHVHVIGAGVMGGDIAAWCALRGLRVTLEDQNVKAIAAALTRALALFKKQLKEPHLVKAAQDRLIPDVKGAGIKNADLIVEAIIEKLDAKLELFARLEREAKAEAVFATNTSTIPLEDLSQNLIRKGRLIGLHFFNPVAKMPLVEVIAGKDSDPATVQQGMSFVRRIDKLPLLVKSAPGFLVNRILMPYLMESLLMLESGIPEYAIDKAALDFGMPMGPIELADAVGLDVCLYGAESLNQHFKKGSIPTILRNRVAAGHLGKKTGYGFYQYKNGKRIPPKIDENYRVPDDVLDRLILCMLNEAVACLREEIVQDEDFLDAGMIFGTGFPPFRGGMMHYLSEQGEALTLQRLNLLAQRYGDRFLPDAGWRER